MKNAGRRVYIGRLGFVWISKVVVGKLPIIPEKNIVEGRNFHQMSKTSEKKQLFTIFSRKNCKLFKFSG